MEGRGGSERRGRDIGTEVMKKKKKIYTKTMTKHNFARKFCYGAREEVREGGREGSRKTLYKNNFRMLK